MLPAYHTPTFDMWALATIFSFSVAHHSASDGNFQDSDLKVCNSFKTEKVSIMEHKIIRFGLWNLATKRCYVLLNNVMDVNVVNGLSQSSEYTKDYDAIIQYVRVNHLNERWVRVLNLLWFTWLTTARMSPIRADAALTLLFNSSAHRST